MPYISNSKIHKCSLQEGCHSSSRSPLWTVRSTQNKCPNGVSSPHTCCRSPGFGAKHGVWWGTGTQEPPSRSWDSDWSCFFIARENSRRWVAQTRHCPWSWFSTMILLYIPAFSLLPSWCSSRWILRCSAGGFKNVAPWAKTFSHVVWGFRGSWSLRRMTKPKAGCYLFYELLSLEVITQGRLSHLE